MANFRAWAEDTRAGNYVVRYRDGKTKLPNGRWKVFTDCGVGKTESAIIDGKRLMGRKLAEALADKLLERFHQNKLGVVSTSESLEELIEKYLDAKKNLAWKTLEHYRDSLNALLKECPSISELTTDNMVAWRTKMQASTLTKNTIYGRLNDTSMFCNWLVRGGKIGATPFIKLATGKGIVPQMGEPTPRFYMTEEYLKLESAVESLSHDAMVGLQLCLRFGLRKVEVVGDGKERLAGVLREDLLYRRDGKVALHIRKEVTKGQKKDRTTILTPKFVELLGSRKTGPLCSLSRSAFDDIIQEAITLSGIAKIKGKFVHALRHTYGKNFIQQSGSSLKALQELLGHKNIKTTEIYSQFEQTYLDGTVEIMSERMDVEESRVKAAGQKADISKEIGVLSDTNRDQEVQSLEARVMKNGA